MANSYDKCLESDLPIVSINGLNTNKAIQTNSTIGATGAITSGGIVTAINATAISGTGTQAIAFTTVANFGIFMGTGIPTVTAATGSLYINNGGTGVASRMYVNSGGTGWVAFTTVT